MVTRAHVAAIVGNMRELADEGTKGRAARTRVAVAALDANAVRASPTLARDLLADELAPWSVDLLAEVLALESDEPDADAEGMLWLDLALVRVLAKVDADEAAKAREGRQGKAADPGLRWGLWSDAATPLGLVKFAGELWSRRVADRWRRGVDRPAAMVRGLVHDRLLPLSRGATLDEATGEVRNEHGERLARLKPGLEVATLDLEVMRRGLDVFRSTLARRLIRYFAHEAHRAEVRGDLRPEIVRIDGGFSGLAEIIGADPGKERVRVRDLLAFGRLLDVSTPGLEVHGLWYANTLRLNAPGQRRALEVVLNHRVFLSGAAESMKATAANTREARRSRLLVPVLRHDPPFRVPNHAEWGRVWSVADAVLVLLVDSGAELAREGCARIDSKAWSRLITDAGLDERRAPTVRARLLEGDGVSPPLVSSIGADRFTLAPEHETELSFILARAASGRRDR